jgi:hypothetical protein
MITTGRDLAAREERCSMTFDIYTPTDYRQLRDEIVFRIYTRHHLDELLQAVPELELIAVHDFAYRMEKEVVINDATEDVVLVLRKG